MNTERPHALRILHTEASKGWGGQEIRILDEASGLRNRGYDVHIAASEQAPIFTAASKRSIPVHPVPLDQRSLSSLLSLVALIRRLRPDVIVTHSSSDSWLAAIATRLPGTQLPIVRMRHLSTPVASGMLNRWLYGRVPAKVVTTGEAIRTLLIETLDLDANKVVSIPTGADPSHFKPGARADARRQLGLPADAPIVGIVATLRSWKGHRFLISAMRDPRLAAARLVIVGEGPQSVALRDQVSAEGLTDRVLFAGQREDVAPWLQALDVFALPSTGNEGVPQALVQAMLSEVPVVTTPVGAIPELVKDGETGLLVAPSDANALAAAVARLLNDPRLARELAIAARRLAAARFGAPAMLDAMDAVLREAAR